MRLPKSISFAALSTFAAICSIAPALAGVVFSESFEAPVVSGFSSNSIPSGGKWIGATQGFGATNRGLYNENVIWPATPPFATPFGAQSYYLNYTNSGLTTAVGATGQTLTAGVTYKVSFNAGVTAGTASGSYLVELVAFAAADTNTVRNECRNPRPGAVLATASGTVTTNTLSGIGQLTFTAAAGNANLGKDLGIRLVKGTNSVLYDNIRLITGHDMNPTPASGVTIAGGNVSLSWTNMPPTSGSDVAVDVWFGTNPAALTKVVTGGINTSSTTVSAPSANTYYWRVDSYPDGNPAGTPITGDVFVFIITDTDNDGFPDSYELANTTPPSNIALNTGDDLDNDGLTNLQEFQFNTLPNDNDTDNDTLLDGPEITGVAPRPATNPRIADTDGDGLSDGVENNTGIWVSASNTGTNPADADRDKDGLKDGVETKTGTLVSRTADTGTDPYLADTDADGAGDWYEVTASFTSPFLAAEKPTIPYPLPDPDGSKGATDKKVKVYIMSGQSNMLGMGTVAGTGDGTLETMTRRQYKFPNLVDGSGNYIPRQDVRYRGVISGIANGPLAPGQGSTSNLIGPELGFGQVMGWYHDEAILLLKSSIGNRSLGWDVLPPASPSYQYGGSNYAAYGDASLKWTIGSPAPTWTTGGWYAGYEWDRYFTNESEWAHPHAAEINVVDILDNWVAEYAATGKPFVGQDFEIAGFVWWQGDKDRYDMGHATRYEQNLVNLINALRNYYSNRYPGKVVANAPFVLATLGQTAIGDTTPASDVAILDAQLAMNDTVKYPQFAGNVKTVYSHPLSEGGASNSHYDGRAGTYMLVGDALGRAMVSLQTTFASWIAGYPSVPPGLAGFDQDADGDGIDNGAENFFGTNPGIGSSGLVAGASSGSTFTFTHPQNATPATGVTAAYRWSKDLATFYGHGQTDGANTTVSFNAVTSAGITTVTATVTGTSTAKLFVDVKVTQN